MSEQDVSASDGNEHTSHSSEVTLTGDLEAGKIAANQLKAAGIKGNEEQLTALAQRFNHDLIALKLLAAYLNRWYSGRPNGVDSLPVSSNSRTPLDLSSVLAAFELRLRDTSDLTLLYLLSLSDRPVAQSHLQSVFHSTLMERWLTRRDDYVRFLSPLGRLSQENWHWVIENLRRLQLVEQPIAGQHDLLFVAEPVRRYFHTQLQNRNHSVYQQAVADMQKLSEDTVVEFRQRFYNTPEIKTWISPELQEQLNLRDQDNRSTLKRTKQVLWKSDELNTAQHQLEALRRSLHTLKDQTRRLNEQLEAHQQCNPQTRQPDPAPPAKPPASTDSTS